jgi:Alcohol dehydrogenase GroES-like domain/SpoIIAA-like
MRAMVLKQSARPLEWTGLPDRQPGPGEFRVKVAACDVCRTELHALDGELQQMKVSIIPGHEIVGRIDAVGPGFVREAGLAIGQRAGIPWLEKVAVVASGPLAAIAPGIANHFVPAQARHFDFTREEEAWDWVDPTGWAQTNPVARLGVPRSPLTYHAFSQETRNDEAANQSS